MNRAHTHARITRFVGALAAWLGLFPVIGGAKDNRPAPQPGSTGKPATESPATDIVTAGTSAAKVFVLLGTPRMGSTIPCLTRRMVLFDDGTKVIFVNERVVSAIPNGLAAGNPATGYIVEVQNRRVFFDPAILCGNDVPSPCADIKRQVEECFLYAPPSFYDIPPPHYPLPRHLHLSPWRDWRERSAYSSPPVVLE